MEQANQLKIDKKEFIAHQLDIMKTHCDFDTTNLALKNLCFCYDLIFKDN